VRADAASNGEAKDWYASPEMKEIREYIDAHTKGRSFAVKGKRIGCGFLAAFSLEAAMLGRHYFRSVDIKRATRAEV